MSRIGYARVSTIDQNLDRQLELLSNCDKVFTDKASGKNLERAGLQDMLDYIREGDIVVVTELMYFARLFYTIMQPINTQLCNLKFVFNYFDFDNEFFNR